MVSTVNARDFKKARLGKGYSQSELAREFSVDVMTISRWERRVVATPRIAELALAALKTKRKRKGD
jgi:transcriptional regulator with XRE-family HTH domain